MGHQNPFLLTPQLLYGVMGALDRAGYRSAELYVDTAKQQHIANGRPWSDQLALAYRRAKRACQRAGGLPNRHNPSHWIRLRRSTWAKARCALRAHCGRADPRSWHHGGSYVKRKQAQRLSHTSPSPNKSSWFIGGSPRARPIGRHHRATRTHSCSCSSGADVKLCPIHAMKQQIHFASTSGSEVVFLALHGGPPSKAGWADTFEEIARRLGQDTHSPQGLRLFTGHSARASGAVHLAHTQVELWQIQLFGRWGSDCFKQYVRDAPLSQLHGLA